MTKVTVFGCGVQKAGTTSLHVHLLEHPQIQGAKKKEVHFFDDEALDWSAPDYDQLHDWYDGPAAGRLRMDVTPIYAFWPHSIERLKAYNPDAKIICLFRDPIERAWSNWSMEYARKGETLTFSQAIRSGRTRLDGVDFPDQSWRVFSYIERGFYADQVARMQRHFPSDQLLFLRCDDLKSKNEAILQQIAAFLQIDAFPKTEVKRAHVRANIEYPSQLTLQDQVYLSDIFYDDVCAFSSLTQMDVSDWLTVKLRLR